MLRDERQAAQPPIRARADEASEQLADRFGIPCGDGKVSDLFTSPDAIKRAARANELELALRREAAPQP